MTIGSPTTKNGSSPPGSKTAVPREIPRICRAKQFVEGWEIGKPDQIVYMREEPIEVPAEGVIDYYHFVADPGWTEDKWIIAAEAKPGSPQTVHHIFVFVQPPDAAGGGFAEEKARVTSRARRATSRRGRGSSARGGERGPGQRGGRGGGRGRSGGGGIGGGNLIAGYAPGMNPMLSTDGTTAMHVKAGSKLVFQLHYTPNGAAQKGPQLRGLQVCRSGEGEISWLAARRPSIDSSRYRPGTSNFEAVAEATFEHDTLLIKHDAAHAPARQGLSLRGRVSRRQQRNPARRAAATISIGRPRTCSSSPS